MDSYPMNTTDGHYPQRQPQWPPHLLAPSHPQASFPSPPASDHGQHYPFFQTQAQQQQQHPDRTPGDPLHRATSSLSLNLSSLTVASPTNLSPINAPSATAALSPVTPISPSTNPFGHQHHLQHGGHGVHNHPHGHAGQHGHSHGHAHNHMQSPFSYDPSQSTPGQQSPGHYDDGQSAPPGSSVGYDTRRTPGPSRSSSVGTSSTSQLPRKRSFTANNASSASLASISPSTGGSGSGGAVNGTGSLSINVNVNPTLVEESMYDDESRDAAMELASAASYDDLEVRTAYGGPSSAGSGPGGSAGAGGSGGGGSPVDGSGSTSGAEDSFGMMGGGVGGTMNILGKPLATNNFVTKLYQ